MSHDWKRSKFTLLADACILGKKSVVKAILSGMHLLSLGMEINVDSLYRCSDCQRRNP